MSLETPIESPGKALVESPGKALMTHAPPSHSNISSVTMFKYFFRQAPYPNPPGDPVSIDNPDQYSIAHWGFVGGKTRLLTYSTLLDGTPATPLPGYPLGFEGDQQFAPPALNTFGSLNYYRATNANFFQPPAAFVAAGILNTTNWNQRAKFKYDRIGASPVKITITFHDVQTSYDTSPGQPTFDAFGNPIYNPVNIGSTTPQGVLLPPSGGNPISLLSYLTPFATINPVGGIASHILQAGESVIFQPDDLCPLDSHNACFACVWLDILPADLPAFPIPLT